MKTRARRGARVRRGIAAAVVGALAIGAVAAGSAASAVETHRTSPGIVQDRAEKTLTLAGGGMSMVIDYDGGARVSSLRIGATEALAAGIWSDAHLAGDDVLDSRALASAPRVRVTGSAATVEFTMTGEGVSVDEVWRLRSTRDGIRWRIDRTYDWEAEEGEVVHNGMLDFGWSRVWDNIRRPDDGGNIPIGNAYAGDEGFYLNEDDDRYGVEQADVTLLSGATAQALAVTADSRDELATEFAYTGDGNTYQETQVRSSGDWEYTAGTAEEGFVFGGHSSAGTDALIYAPVTIADGQRDSVTFTFAPGDYAAAYDLDAELPGVSDTARLSSLLNDFGRSGMVDEDYGMMTVGLRYPGVGPYDMVHADRTVLGYYEDEMIASHQKLLAYFRDNAQLDSGHMRGRTFHRTHEWGDDTLNDADPAYALSVAAMYDAEPDAQWLGDMRGSVEDALGFMLDDRFSEETGFFHNDATSCTSQRGAKEWNDAFFVRYASGHVNTLMYGALTEWADLESAVFGDDERAARYADAAAQLKAQFNRSTSDGGLWDEESGMFAYWRCPDGTVEGVIQQTQVNLQAIIYGLVDLDRAQSILDRIDLEMQRNGLDLLPLNFQPLSRDEEWSGDHFQTGLEDGAIYPLMTEQYMRAAALVGERERSLPYLESSLDLYERDGYVGYSYVTWDGSPKPQEAWFPSNANAATGLFLDVLGLQPTAEGVTIAPNIPESMDGASLTRTVHGRALTVTYESQLAQTISYRAPGQTVTVQWSGQEPGARLTVTDGHRTHRVTADDFGIVRYEFPASGTRTVRLIDGNAAGYVLPEGPRPSISIGAEVTASSSLEDGASGAATVVDGNRWSADGTWGYSSDAQLDADHEEWLMIDLGEVVAIDRVQLHPRTYDARPVEGFPGTFRIETSADGESWSTVAEESDYPTPAVGERPAFDFEARDARFVRVTGSQLPTDEDGAYRMQFAELSVYAAQ